MLLVIHNLPKMMRYEEVKNLIRDRCNLTDIIVDNLMLETTLTRKVTIGLTDESDADIVFKELNGLVLDGRKIVVEDVRKQQDSGNRYKPSMAQNSLMQTQYASYSLSSGGNYSFTGMGTSQNTQIPYRGVPSSFDNNQQQMGRSSAPDFIPFNADKPNYNNDKSDRYFNWGGNDQPSDVRGGRSSYSNDGSYADWNRNRSDEYPRRSDSDNAGGSSLRDPYRWDRGDDRRKNNDDASSTRFDNTYARQYDDRQRRDNSYDRPAKRPKVSHFEEPSARSNFGSGYSGQNRGNQREHGGAPDRGYQNRAEQNHSFKNAPKKAPYSRGQDFKPPRSATNAGNQPWSQPKSFPPPKAQKNVVNPVVIKNKDETWRGQAASAIVKDLLIENGMLEFVKKQCLLSYIKPIVRSRIDQMLGKRVAVPLAQIIEEYKRRNPPGAQTEFIIEERKKYEWTRFNSGEITSEEYEATVSQLNAQLDQLRRRGPKPFHLSKKQKKAKPAPKRAKTPPPASVLPKYPNGDKKEYKELKRLEKTVPGVYDHKLDPKLKKALDNELTILCDMFREECQKAENDEEKNIGSRILETIEVFKQQINLNVSKRLLNITKNLPLMAFTEQKVNSKEVKEQLKSLGIATFRKCLGKNKYVATCRTFEQYDHFCAQAEFVINGQKIVFRPLHVGRPSKKKKVKQNENVENEAGNEGQEDIDDDNGDDNEGFGDEGDELDYYEDEEMCDDIIDDDDNKDDKKVIQVKHEDTNVDESNTEVKSDCGSESKTEIADPETKTESQVDTKAEEGKVKIEMADEKTNERETTEKDKLEQKSEETVNELDNAETAKLYQDIQALSNSINEGSVENPDENNFNIEENQNISQEDLEDF